MTATFEELSLIRVLVIDDQQPVRQWVRNVLNSMGISRISEAADGREAFAAVTQHGSAFDLILCDLRMPERDGVETIRSFATLGLTSAIAIMSVEDERIIETAGMLAGIQGLQILGTVSKPLTVEKVQPLLERLRHPKGRQECAVRPAPQRDFAKAFARGELYLQYQPKIWIRTGRFAGVEALVRWKHPELGEFKPAAFVTEMEASDHYSAALSDFSLRSAIACAGRWLESGRELRIAINLSVRAFDRLDLPERIESLALDARVPPELITLEVTETQVALDAMRMVEVATRLRLKGFRLSIDDFGTGQSGLLALQSLPFSELKIDRRFVHGCATSGSKRSVVEASLSLARNLNMTSVAEGIQQRPDWELVDELGCDVMQGYFIGRPMSEEGLEAWVAQWTMRS